jgi:hypothetical protein
MATFVRNRVLQQLSWEDESEDGRARRREALCELDGILSHLEEINLRGAEIPARILVKLRRQGVVCRPGITSAELIEAIFAVQERYMRQPEGTVQGDLIGVSMYQRRAS